MKIILLLWALINVRLVCAEAPNTPPTDDEEWNTFKAQFGRTYASAADEQRKKEVHKENLEKIKKHNERYQNGQESFQMAMNRFGDMTEAEFEESHLTALKSASQLSQLAAASASDDTTRYTWISSPPPYSRPVPKSKNWAHEGAVTGVKMQDPCGCCWAFAVTAAIESHNFIYGKDKNLVSLSEQNLLDCVGIKDGINHSCQGGTTLYPYLYVIDNNGIATEQSYPFEFEQGKCRYKPKNKGATIKSCNFIVPENEKLMMDIVGTTGPIVSLFYAEKEFIQFYKSGIYSSKTCSNDQLNHGVLIVGYGRDEKSKTDYWIAKNSWSTDWGEDGYFRIKRNVNECSCSLVCSFPTI